MHAVFDPIFRNRNKVRYIFDYDIVSLHCITCWLVYE